MSEPVLQLSGIVKRFDEAGSTLTVLDGLDLRIAPGELVALVGPSGAGKSTLLHVAGLLEKPDAGTIRIEGEDASEASERQRTRLRRSTIGFVYQYHHLLREFSARENIAMPQRIAGVKAAPAGARADGLLEQIGLSARATHRPGQLSGGEQQRVAIARALANDPALLLADEPTGNLDPSNADAVFALLLSLIRGSGRAALIATHNPALAARMDRTVTLAHGRIV